MAMVLPTLPSKDEKPHLLHLAIVRPKVVTHSRQQAETILAGLCATDYHQLGRRKRMAMSRARQLEGRTVTPRCLAGSPCSGNMAHLLTLPF